MPLGVLQARRAINQFQPDVVLATGGYVAVPAGLAARMCHRPLVLYEQTVRLGLANRKLASAAARICLSSESTLGLLPESARADAVVTGNPVRPEVLSGQADRAVQALALGGFDRSLATVYVTGGAQGSQQINELVGQSLPWMLQRANVIHQCGPANEAACRRGRLAFRRSWRPATTWPGSSAASCPTSWPSPTSWCRGAGRGCWRS
ncbi:UDP-N-acetylglucosamine--N-acetylmuramyl-(pentapeptide) pyrophosphoryl-undecaprenol N-acetylglucosamine transferase [Streptomyces sp. F-1]|nr:UDP-N-acetylglucosamine--N-acetylmuramyl-(pentapeptide) pyrophosphoryl-undecaprenol N-acetylglucosamine transferase [Streptomyces sp. F-1]